MNQPTASKRKVVVSSKPVVKKPVKSRNTRVTKQEPVTSTNQKGGSNPSSSTTSNNMRKIGKQSLNKDIYAYKESISDNSNRNSHQDQGSNDSKKQMQAITFTRNNQQYTINLVSENMIGSGSFGVVFLARIAETGERIAIKKVLQDSRYKNRELEIMQMINHPNVVEMKHHFFSVSSSKDVYLHLALEYVPDTVYRYTYSFTNQNQYMPIIYVKLFTYQLLRALNYIHSIDICHRDIKPQNLLIDPATGILKICDFGSAKQLVPSKANVAYICSRYYRAPELIFGATFYTTCIDTWSAGCVMGEMLLGQPLFPGDSSLNQLIQIIDVLGTPSKKEIEAMNPNYSNHRLPKVKAKPWERVFKNNINIPESAYDLLSKLLCYTPNERIKCIDALIHPFFDELRDQSTHLPNGAALPSLFDFSANELKMSENPNLISNLIPDWYKN